MSAPSIYLNACSHGLPDPTVAQAVAQAAVGSPGDPDTDIAIRARARQACAAFLGVETASVALGGGTFQLWAAIMERLPDRPGRILVAAHEWGDHVRWLRRMEARGQVTLDVVARNDGAPPSASDWAAKMGDDVLALCLPIVTSVAGLRYLVREIAALERPPDALVVVDAAQALGRVSVAPHELDCDVLVGTARKWLRGPRQTAMAWTSQRAERALGGPARTVEPGDLNAALLAGLTQAVELARGRGGCDRRRADRQAGGRAPRWARRRLRPPSAARDDARNGHLYGPGRSEGRARRRSPRARHPR